MYEQTQEIAQQIQEANRRIGADAQDLTEFTKQTTEQAKQVVSQSSQNLSQTYQAISQAMLSAAIRHSQTISQTTQQTSQAIANGLDQSVIAFLTAFNRALGRTSRRSSSLLQLLPVLIGLGVQAISRITNELRQSAPRVARRLSQSLQSISQSFASVLHRRSRSIADATQQTVKQAGRSFSNRLSRAMQSFSNTISQAFSRATNRARSLFQTILAPITSRTPTRPTAEAGAEAGAGTGAIAGASTTLLTITAIATAITAAVMVIRSILQILQAFYNRLLRSSAILQSVHDLFSRTWEFYFKPIGDVLGLLLLPVALMFFRRAIAFYRSFIPIFQRIGDWISGRASFSDFLADILNADNISRTTKNLVVMLVRLADAIAFVQGLVIGAFRGFGRALANAFSPLTAALRTAASSSHEFLNVLDPQRWAEFGDRLGYIVGRVLGEVITWPWQLYLTAIKTILDIAVALTSVLREIYDWLSRFIGSPSTPEEAYEALADVGLMSVQTGGYIPTETIAHLHPGEYVLTPAEFTLLIHAISDLRDAITYQPRPTPRPPPTININLTIEAESGLDRTKLESLADDLVDIISRKLMEVGP
ncbi:MAG: hypothetical protein DRP85_08720 [Candidatus Makaraimicrobium thalassicum]|nr:MAG: hypothetical protein DRP85_08720 [Candidatus Omnitrophota bacterium]